MSNVDMPLRLADPDDIVAALTTALTRDGRRRWHGAEELMARIVADILAEELEHAGFHVMRRPPEQGGVALGFGFGQTR